MGCAWDCRPRGVGWDYCYSLCEQQGSVEWHSTGISLLSAGQAPAQFCFGGARKTSPGGSNNGFYSLICLFVKGRVYQSGTNRKMNSALISFLKQTPLQTAALWKHNKGLSPPSDETQNSNLSSGVERKTPAECEIVKQTERSAGFIQVGVKVFDPPREASARLLPTSRCPSIRAPRMQTFYKNLKPLIFKEQTTAKLTSLLILCGTVYVQYTVSFHRQWKRQQTRGFKTSSRYSCSSVCKMICNS